MGKSLGQSNEENSSKGVSMTDKGYLKSKSSVRVDDVLSSRNFFTCKVCLKVNFNTNGALRKHLSYHPHSLCTGKVSVCYICDEKFDLEDEGYKVHLERHFQKMRRTEIYKCLGCYYNFNSSEELLMHVSKVHESNVVFPCPKCEKCFKRKKQLMLHIETIHDDVAKALILDEV